MFKRAIIHKVISAIAICMLIAFNIYTDRLQEATSSAPAEGVKLAVLMYHGFKEKGTESTYVLRAASFEKDIIYLKENNFEFVVIEDLINYAYYGKQLPEKCVMLTFDDGYLNNYVYAFPIIKKYKAKAVISPIAYWSDYQSENPDSNPAYAQMTWDHIKEMSTSGMVEIQNHSYNMHSLDKGRKGSAKADGETSREYRKIFFEDLLMAHRAIYNATGIHPTAYTYPFGSISPESKTIIKCFGYKASFSCSSGYNYITRDPESLYMLRRFNRTPDKSASILLSDY